MPAGRPKKLTLDFFIHDAKARGDRKIRGLRRRHGNDGYATFFILLEMLCQEPNLILDLSTPIDLETAVEECGVRDIAHFHSIVQTCVDLGLFNRQLWESDRSVFSHGLQERYLKRLEKRQKEAEYKKEKRKAESYQKKQEEVESQNPEPRIQNSEIQRSELRDLELRKQNIEEIHRHQTDNSIVHADNQIVRTDNSDLCLSYDLQSADADCQATESKTETIAPLGSITSRDTVDDRPWQETSAAISLAVDKWEQYREVYNQGKPKMWAAIAKVNPARQKVFKQLERDCGGMEAAIACLQGALAYARSDSFWSSKNLAFENFASNGKILQLYEKAVARQSVPQAVTDLANSPNNVRMMEQRDRLLRVIQGTSA